MNPALRAAAAAVDDALGAGFDEFRSYQDPSGAVVREHERAERLVRELSGALAAAARRSGVESLAEPFASDVDRWLHAGLETKPAFDATLAAYEPPSDGQLTLFAGPVVATNGPPPRGHFLEWFLSLREEPEECHDLARELPHPKNTCQSTRILAGSRGFITGNCIVFFPENLAVGNDVTAQKFATFFFNKFHLIYGSDTIPRVARLLGPDERASARLTPGDCYRARSMWGYLHDYYHHRGPRPFDENMRVKMKFDVGLLEEIKVDCQSAVAACERDLPFGREIVEFILFERMFRYPGQPDALTNFDAGTGVLLFEWLLRENDIRPANGHLDCEVERCVEGMSRLAAAIEELERIEDDDEYVAAATGFVRTLVPEGRDGDRFSIPEGFARYADVRASSTPPLSFHDLPY